MSGPDWEALSKSSAMDRALLSAERQCESHEELLLATTALRKLFEDVLADLRREFDS